MTSSWRHYDVSDLVFHKSIDDRNHTFFELNVAFPLAYMCYWWRSPTHTIVLWVLWRHVAHAHCRSFPSNHPIHANRWEHWLEWLFWYSVDPVFSTWEYAVFGYIRPSVPTKTPSSRPSNIACWYGTSVDKSETFDISSGRSVSSPLGTSYRYLVAVLLMVLHCPKCACCLCWSRFAGQLFSCFTWWVCEPVSVVCVMTPVVYTNLLFDYKPSRTTHQSCIVIN